PSAIRADLLRKICRELTNTMYFNDTSLCVGRMFERIRHYLTRRPLIRSLIRFTEYSV
ncbi:hypothetical protein L9F63_012224, partial [Diploptera punctata]